MVILLPQLHEYWDYRCKLPVKRFCEVFIVGKQVLSVCLVMLGIKLRTPGMWGKAPFCVPLLTACIVKYTLSRTVPNTEKRRDNKIVISLLLVRFNK